MGNEFGSEGVLKKEWENMFENGRVLEKEWGSDSEEVTEKEWG